MHDTDARTPTNRPRDQPGAGSSPAGPRRLGRSRWLVALVAVGITVGVGAAAMHGGDRGFTGSICEALERTGSAAGATTHCAPAAAADSR